MKKDEKIAISFEFFPPKSAETQEKLLREATKLATVQPNFFSVTYGAGGSTREGTLSTIRMLQQHSAVTIAPHLSCIGSKREQIIEMLMTYQAMGLNRIVALRGDMPSGMGQIGDLHYACELVALIREATGDHFHIEVAAYPECHPQAQSLQQDVLNFKKKVDAGADSAITQYFYNTDAYFYFRDACALEGVHIPIVPGIMPITCFNRLARFSSVCGAEIPQWMRKRFESYGDDVESVQAFGIEVVHGLSERLLAGGAPGLHFYTLNNAYPTLNIVDVLQPMKRPLAVVQGEVLAF